MARKLLTADAEVSERHLAQLEAGKGNASVVLLHAVGAALGLQVFDLLDPAIDGAEQRMLRRFLDSLPVGQETIVRRRHSTLIGRRGAGKSTLGQGLARAPRRPSALDCN